VYLKIKILPLLAFVSLLCLHCSKTSEGNIPLAKADGDELTMNDITSRFDTTSSKSKQKLKDYINHWLNTTVLYKEAIDRDITGSEEYEDMLNQAKREIAVNLLLKDEIYGKHIEITDGEIEEYYQRHRNEFFLGNDVVNFSFATFINESSASEFRKLYAGGSWKEAVKDFIDSHAQDLVVTHQDSAYYKQTEIYPPDIWKSIIPLRVGELSLPLQVFDGIMIVKMNSYQRAGEIGSIDYAKSEILERLTVDKKRYLYLNFLKTLHQKFKSENYYEYSNK